MNVHFVITMGAKELEKAEQQGLLEFFRLTSKINTGNMICFDFEGKIKKYDSAEDLLEDFYPVRLAYYQKRKVRMGVESLNLNDDAKHFDRTTLRMSCKTRSKS